MILDKPALERLYQGLNLTFVNIKKKYDHLLKGGSLTSMQNELTSIGKDIDALGVVINQLYSQIKSANRKHINKMASTEDLAGFSNYLDDNGFYCLADKVDEVIKIGSLINNSDLSGLQEYLDNGGFYLLANNIEDVADQFESYFFIPTSNNNVNYADDGLDVQDMKTHHLSSRCCPDHRGVQMARIGDSVYQCPIDGKEYNWATGYKTYDNKVVPGGSISNQTEYDNGYNQISSRIWDTRSNVLSRIL